MKKERKLEKNSNRSLSFRSLLFGGLILVAGFIIGQVVPQIAPAANADSVKLENVALRQALTAKMESHCDTMTVDQKLAHQKFSEYKYKMYEIKNDQEFKAHEVKRDKEIKAFTAMDRERVQVIFKEYWEGCYQALLKVEEINPTIFKEYAVTLYKQERLGYDYSARDILFERLKTLEKNKTIANYLKKEKELNAIKTQKDSENEKKYQTKLAEIENEYQSQLLAIEQDYNKKISAKKAEIGL